jgi:hypothetical protein
MSPPNISNDDNVSIHLANEIEMAIDSLDYTLASCSNNNGIFLLLMLLLI